MFVVVDQEISQSLQTNEMATDHVTVAQLEASRTAETGVASLIRVLLLIQEGLLSVTSKSMYTKYWLTS